MNASAWERSESSFGESACAVERVRASMQRELDEMRRSRDDLMLERDKLVYRVSVLERQLSASLHSSNESFAS